MSKPKGYPKDARKGPDGLMRDGRGRICTEWGDRFYDGPILWNPPKVDIPADARDALPGLWDGARQVWECIWIAYHGIVGSIAGDAIWPREHKLLGDWVRNAELMLRRIILIAALTLEPAPLKPLKPAPARKTGARAKTQRTGVVLDNPETWQTSFRLFPSRRDPTQPRSRRRRTGTPRRPTARGYALRVEAMRRVIARREVYALRTARRLQRIALANRTANSPRELNVATWTFHPSERTHGKHLVEETMRLVQPLACRAVEAFNRRHLEPG
jgi:hypothetical protein